MPAIRLVLKLPAEGMPAGRTAQVLCTLIDSPDRLEPVRRLIEDLRSTEEGRAIVPDELYEISPSLQTSTAHSNRS